MVYVAVDLGREFLVESEPTHRQRRDHEQEQQRPHAVVRRTFPHLGVEMRVLRPRGWPPIPPVIPLGVPGRGFAVWGQLVHGGRYKDPEGAGAVVNESLIE
jgi:hypothetical protein